MTKPVRKRCVKCGDVGERRPRERRCKAIERRFGHRYYCWGKLERVAPKKRVKPTPIVPAPETPQAKALSDMTDAAARMERFQRAFNRYVGNLRRYGTPKWAKLAGDAAYELRRWEQKVRYYEKRSQMSDQQVAAERERLATARRPKRKRAISLTKELT